MSRLDAREQLQTLAARLQAARQCQQIYPPKHPRLAQAIDELYADLRAMFDGDEPLRIAYTDHEFVLGNAQIAVSAIW